MIRNIFFIDRPPFNKDFYIRYEFEQLKAKGFNVRSLDISRYLKGTQYENVTPAELEPFVLHFNSKSDFVEFIEKHSNDSIIISLVPFLAITSWMYLAIFKSEIPYLLVSNAVYPDFGNTPIKKNRIEKYRRSIKRLKFKNLFLKLFDGMVFISAKLNKRSADVVFYSLEKENGIVRKLVGENTLKSYVFSPDYKLAMRTHHERIFEEPYAVFIDQYFCHHLDFRSHQILHSFSAADYYPVLTKFLLEFQEKTGLKVVVASHPRRNEILENDFGRNFPLIYNQTAQLVKDSEIVLQHFSTAVSFSVIFKKPFILLNSKMFEGTVDKKITEFASFFNKKMVYFENGFNPVEQDFFSVNADVYNQYSNRFLKHPKAEHFKTFTDSVLDFINHLQ